MTMDVKPSLGEMTWLIGRTYPQKAPRRSRAKLVLPPVLAIVGSVSWILLAGPSDAESQPVPVRSPVLMSAQNPSWLDPAITRIQATSEVPAGEALKIALGLLRERQGARGPIDP